MMKSVFAVGVALLLSSRICSPQAQEHPRLEPEAVADHDDFFIPQDAAISSHTPDTIVRSVLQDRKGTLWFATFSGILRHDGKVFTNVSMERQLRPYRAFSVFEDRQGNLWFGMVGAGLYRYDGKTFTNLTRADGLADDKVEAMVQDAAGTIWFGTGAGVSAYDGKTFRNYRVSPDPPGNDVHGLALDGSGRLLAAAAGGLFRLGKEAFAPLMKPDGTPFDNVRTILRDHQGRIWFGGGDGLWRLEGDQPVFVNSRFAGYLMEDRAGKLWLSAGKGPHSSSMGLFRLDPDSLTKPGDPEAMAPRTEQAMIFGTAEDRQGRIWLGTLNGVRRLDGTTVHTFPPTDTPSPAGSSAAPDRPHS